MKTRHDGDCSIYASLDNDLPEAGICTCGYGNERIGVCDYSEMYSKELQEKLKAKRMDREDTNKLVQKLREDKTTSENPDYLEALAQIFKI